MMVAQTRVEAAESDRIQNIFGELSQQDLPVRVGMTDRESRHHPPRQMRESYIVE